MGWFGNLFSSNSDDPLAKLDPKVREFLEKESPVKYTKKQNRAAEPTKPLIPSPQAQQQQPEAVQDDGKQHVPSESLFQDGRYAHLWKTYQSQADVDAVTKSDHEKLTDVMDAYRSRKARIGRVALENCAVEQSEWRACMTSGDVTARMTMCRVQVQKFERCYTMQTVSRGALP
jgi:hypothetical protein